MPALPFERVPGGLSVKVRVVPRAGPDRVDGVVESADGRPAIRVRVGAAPEGGRANRAVTALLAREWRLAKGALSIVAGATGRTKTILVSGDGALLERRLALWLRERRG